MSETIQEAEPRPSYRSEAVKRAAAARLVPALKEWLEGEGDRVASDDQLADHIFTAIKYGDSDGYEVAKRMESEGYVPDARLVEILDGVDHEMYAAHEELAKEWVERHQVAAKLKVGDRVSASRFNQPSYDKSKFIGEIVQVYADIAKYGVREDGGRPDSHAIVDFESVELVPS